MKAMQDYLLLSFHRAGPEAVRNGLLALAGSAALVGLAFLVVLIFAPPRVPSQGNVWADSPVGAVNRLGKVVYGPGTSDVRCRRFQFDNRTAALEQAEDTECATALGHRRRSEGQSQQSDAHGAVRR